MFKLYAAPEIEIGTDKYPEQREVVRDFLYSLLLEFMSKDQADEIIKITVFWPGERKIRSALLGELVAPTEGYPDGIICLYPDAIKNFCDFAGIDVTSYTVSTFFHEVRHYIDRKKYGTDEGKEEKAEIYAKKITKKLANRGIIKEDPPSGNTDPYLPRVFNMWVKEWTGCKDLLDWHQTLMNSDLADVKND